MHELRREFEARHRYWRSQPLDPSVATLLTVDAYRPAERFWEVTEREFLPALSHGDAAKASAAYRQLSDLYAEHRGQIDRWWWRPTC